jgi:hypothetical protein
MDQVLASLDFVKCHIDDITVFISTMKKQDVFKHLGTHKLKLHLGKCRFLQSQMEYLGHMIYPRGLGDQKAKVDAISKVPILIDLSCLKAFLGLTTIIDDF